MYDMQAIINYYQKNEEVLEGGDINSRVKIDLLSNVTTGVHSGLKSTKSLVKNDLGNLKQGVI